MKKYLLLVAVIVLTQSCTKTVLKENPESSLTVSELYTKASDLTLGMGGLALRFNGAFNQTWGITYAGDDLTSKNAGNKIGFSEIDVFKSNNSNSRMTNWWSYFYSTINSANFMIKNHQKATDATETLKDNAAGVGYFYRAISYYFLTRTWGEVPLNIDGAITNNRTNASVKDIYTQIVADLINAEKKLPVTWTGNMNQQGVNILPTQGAAKALLADVYLTMAGWPLKQVDKYALAASKAKEVIDAKATYGYQLEAMQQLWHKRFTPETIFGCYYNVNAAGGQWENGSQMGPLAFAPEEEGGWEDGFGEINFYNNFPEGPRKAETYQKDYFIKDAKKVILQVVDYTKTKTKHPFFLKYRYDNYDLTTHSSLNWWGSATIPVIRYAGVLLIYAEAKAQSSGVDPSAYDAINQVRQRAGLKNLSPGLSTTAFRDSVLMERAWEFAGPEPTSRWFDLQRTERVAKANANKNVLDVPIAPENMPNDQSHKGYWLSIPSNN